MKKFRLAVILTLIFIASAINFGIITKHIGINLSYGCNAGNLPTKNYYNFTLPCVHNGQMGELIDCDLGGAEYCNEKKCS